MSHDTGMGKVHGKCKDTAEDSEALCTRCTRNKHENKNFHMKQPEIWWLRRKKESTKVISGHVE